MDKKQFEGDSVGEVSGMRSGFPVAGSSVSFVSDIPLHDSDSSLYDSGTLLEVVDNGVDNVSHVSGGCLGWWGCFRLMFVEGRGIGSFMSFGGFIILCVEVVVAVVLFIVLSSVGEVKFDV